MSYRNRDLITLSFDLDASELEQRLESLGGLDEDRVRELIAEDGMTEDRVQELLAAKVEDYIRDAGLLSESDVEDIFRNMAHSEGEDFVRDTISNEGYVTEDDVRNLIDERDDALDEDDVRRIADEAISEADNADVRDLERRFEIYASKVDTCMQHVDDTETAERIARLEAEVRLLTERNETALTFFDLLRQAMALLRR